MENPSPHPFDALLPSEMAEKAETLGVAKASMPLFKTLMLSILAGAFIALGAGFMTTVTAGSTLSFGMTRLIGGFCFSLGLILVIVGGAELFTGNNLIVMAWANRKIGTLQVLRNWVIVYVGNLIGALSIALMMIIGRQYALGDGQIARSILKIAEQKCAMAFLPAFMLGVLCNVLVCLAVWISFSARTTSGKMLSVVLPVAAFVTMGFEHSIANMYFVPLGMMAQGLHDPLITGILSDPGLSMAHVSVGNFLWNNLIPVTLGNLVGGAGLVGFTYWLIYLRRVKPNRLP